MDKETQKVWRLRQNRVKKVFHKGVKGQLHQILLETEQDGLDDSGLTNRFDVVENVVTFGKSCLGE